MVPQSDDLMLEKSLLRLLSTPKGVQDHASLVTWGECREELLVGTSKVRRNFALWNDYSIAIICHIIIEGDAASTS